MEEFRLAQLPARMETVDIDEVVSKSLDIYKKVEWKDLPIRDKANLGNALALSGHCEEAYEVLNNSMETVWNSSINWGRWLSWQAGWAAWMLDDESRYKEALRRAMKGADGELMDRKSWDYTAWIAAYLLGDVTEKEFVESCGDAPNMLDDPDFFRGEKYLKSKDYAKALEAYSKSAAMDEKAPDKFPGNWAKWRVKQVQNMQKEREESR